MNHTRTLTRGIRLSVVAVVAVLLVSLLAVTQPARADTIKVENNNDSGPGSLRQAITDAHTNPGDDTIIFIAATNGTPIVLAGAASEDANASGDLDILDGGDRRQCQRRPGHPGRRRPDHPGQRCCEYHH